MAADISEFLNLLYSQVDRGIYVWGGNGQDLTAMPDPVAWIERREEDPANEKRDIALFNERKEAGVSPIQAFDCSGLVYWALHTLGLQKTDLSSRGFYSLCRPIEEKDLRPGDLVFHHDGKQIVHVGVCVGEDQIECKGRDVGVVKNKRRPGYWNRFGRLPCFDGDQKTNRYVKVLGGSVRVRDKDGVYGRCIGIAHRGEEYPYIETAPSGWYKIEYQGSEAYVTNKPHLTEVVFDV